MPLIHCIMASASPPDAAAKCLSGLGIVTTSAARIEQCAASARGEALLHEVGIRTQTLDPPLDFVPWLTFNDVSEQIEDSSGLSQCVTVQEFSSKAMAAAQNNLTWVLCCRYLHGGPQCEGYPDHCV